MNAAFRVAWILIIALLLAGCPARTPTPAPTATATPQPTATQAPTATPAPTETPAPAPASISETIENHPDLTTLAAAIGAADLVEKLQDGGPFTLFAPTDDAFAALPDGQLDEWLADPGGELTDILLYHLVTEELPSTELLETNAVSVLEDEIRFTAANDELLVDDAKVIVRDIETTNGIIHLINKVLTPPSLAGR